MKRPDVSLAAADLASRLVPQDEPVFAAFALRTRSPLARAALELLAQDGVPWGHTSARLTALDTSDEQAWQDGLTRYRRILADLPVEAWPRVAATTYAQLLLRTGSVDELAQILPALDLDPLDRWSLRTDLANPFRAGGPGAGGPGAGEEDTRSWLGVLGEIVDDGLAPVTVVPGEALTPYQRLSAPTDASCGGDLVTVVMSAYDPTPDLRSAVRSVLDQTWQDLELVIVDDASTRGTELLEEAGAMDPRVRVLRAPVNAGTYAARNLALEHASGRYVTFHDSDDWIHPQRLQVQVEALADDPRLLATRTWALRAYPDLTFTYVGYSAHRLNASSLLFERDPVLRLVGHFDATRKSGDMEYPLRLNAVRPHSVADLRHPFPMAITQLRHDSLSRTDAVPGWTRWDRLAYREAYGEWHSRIKSGRAQARLTPVSSRPFRLPRVSWEPRGGTDQPWDVDVAVLGDLRYDHPRSSFVTAAALSAAAAGGATAFLLQETPQPASRYRPRMLPEAQRVISSGAVPQVDVQDPGHAATLLVADPTALLHTRPPVCSADRVLVLLVSSRGGGAEPTDAEIVAADQVARSDWGTSAVGWVPGDSESQDRLGALLGSAHVHPEVVRPAVPVPSALLPRGRRPADTLPVIGHHLPDRAVYWPETADDTAAAYPVDGGWDVRFLGGCATGARRLRSPMAPPGWLSLAGTGMTTQEFLSHLDLYVYQGPWTLVAEVAALEAMAAGRPAVLPPSARPHLHEAAACTGPSGAAAEVQSLLSDPGRSDALARAGRRLVLQRLSSWRELLLQARTHLHTLNREGTR